MSRIIKFRAWDKRDRTMIPDFLSFCEDMMIRNLGNPWKNPEFFELMQYTGLKDKNGKEIYEGDIVINYDMDWRGYIEYDAKRNAGFELIHDNGTFGDICRDKLEIIGNIYETPELLPDSK